MTIPALSTLLLAGALQLWPASPAGIRLAALHRPPARSTLDPRLAPALVIVSSGALAAALGAWPLAPPVMFATWRLLRRRARRPGPPPDPLRLAAAWDLLAACLRSGLPVPTAIRAIATDLPGPEGKALRETSDLLAMGADPGHAWNHATTHPATAPLARAARRTARSGTALAVVAATLATEVRAAVREQAEARAQRAGVLIAGPLGLCFLPAFLCVGVAPVVAGLAAQLHLG
jgi:pilus assembly protein TadC